jgi:hypothetical protein
MGLRDRIAKAIATGNIEKAPNLPAGSVVMSETDMANVANAMRDSYGNSNPLPRNPWLNMVPFGPGMPITPGAINPVDPATGRPQPRQYEYQVAQNINVTETRLVPFKTFCAVVLKSPNQNFQVLIGILRLVQTLLRRSRLSQVEIMCGQWLKRVRNTQMKSTDCVNFGRTQTALTGLPFPIG